MSYIEKEKLIKADIASIENRVRHAFNQGYDLGLKDGKKRVKPLEQESRKDEVILTKEEYGELVSSEFDNGYAKGYREALEQEPCEDCISRKSLLGKATYIELANGNKGWVVEKGYIEDLPSVKPARPNGKWIKMRNGQLECNKCYTRQNKALNYCPYCGAEMVQGNDTKITKELSNKQ